MFGWTRTNIRKEIAAEFIETLRRTKPHEHKPFQTLDTRSGLAACMTVSEP